MFLGNFGLQDTLQERIAPKPIEIDFCFRNRKAFS